MRTVKHSGSDKFKIVVDMSYNYLDLILHWRNLGLSVSVYNKSKASDIKIISIAFRPIYKEARNGPDHLCKQKLNDLYWSW